MTTGQIVAASVAAYVAGAIATVVGMALMDRSTGKRVGTDDTQDVAFYAGMSAIWPVIWAIWLWIGAVWCIVFVIRKIEGKENHHES